MRNCQKHDVSMKWPNISRALVFAWTFLALNQGFRCNWNRLCTMILFVQWGNVYSGMQISIYLFYWRRWMPQKNIKVLRDLILWNILDTIRKIRFQTSVIRWQDINWVDKKTLYSVWWPITLCIGLIGLLGRLTCDIDSDSLYGWGD